MAYYPVLLWFCFYLMLVIADEKKLCDLRKCKYPPWTHYKSLKCKPIFRTKEIKTIKHPDLRYVMISEKYRYTYEDDCCPIRFNCDHLYSRIGKRHNTCYINGKEYALGEKLRDENSILCEEDCTCISKNGFADFKCKTRKYCPPYRRSRPGCYQEKPIEECCSTKEICPNETWERVLCMDYDRGTDLIYSPGEYQIDLDLLKENKIAICEGNRTDLEVKGLSGFKYIDHRRWYDIHAAAGFYKNCAPVYLLDEQGFIGIHRKTWRCYKPSDYVYVDHTHKIVKNNADHGPLSAMFCNKVDLCSGFSGNCLLINPEGPKTIQHNFEYIYLCLFGQMTMHIGDELKRIPYEENSCIVCSCEIPPALTCVLHQYACNMFRHCTANDIIYGNCHEWSFYHAWRTSKGIIL